MLLVLAVAVTSVVLASFPLFGSGIPRGHDLIWEIIRLHEYQIGLSDGVAWPRVAPNLAGGYGYPIFQFFPPVFQQLVARPASMGMGLADAVSLALVVLAGTTWIGTFLLGRIFLYPIPSAALAAAYVLCPYRFYDVFGRNAWSELTAASIVPWLLWAIAKVFASTKPLSSSLVLAVVACLFACSHNLSTVMYAPLCAVWVAFCARQYSFSRFWWVFASGVLGACMAAGYILPAIQDLQFVTMNWSATNAPDPVAALLSPRHLGQPVWSAQLMWTIGCIAAGALGVATRGLDRFTALWAVVAALYVSLTLAPAGALWTAMPQMDPIAFPWRLLFPGSLALLVCIATAWRHDSTSPVGLRWQRTQVTALVFGSFVVVGAHLMALREPLGERFEVDSVALSPAAYRQVWLTTTMIDEFLPAAVQQRPTRFNPPPFQHSPGIQLSAIDVRSHGRTALANVDENSVGIVHIPLLAFPGWQVLVDGAPTEVRLDPDGTMRVRLPPGTHQISVQWAGTNAELAGAAIGRTAWALWALAWLVVGLHWRRTRLDAGTEVATATQP